MVIMTKITKKKSLFEQKYANFLSFEMYHEASEQLYHELSLCVHILPTLLILVLLKYTSPFVQF